MYTTTTDENIYDAITNNDSRFETNYQNIHPTTIGFYDNDCLNIDGNDASYTQYTHVEVNTSGQSFYHLNYGILDDDYVRQ